MFAFHIIGLIVRFGWMAGMDRKFAVNDN